MLAMQVSCSGECGSPPPLSQRAIQTPDTVVRGLFDNEQPSAGAPAELGKLVEAGEAKGSFKALALTHAEGKRWLTVGLGARKDSPRARPRRGRRGSRARP